MTIITLRRGRQVIEVLAHRSDTVMATAAATQYLEVIHGHRRVPDVGTVTVLADVGGANVIQALTRGRHAIMTVTTGLGGNILVIEVRWQPAIGTVTIIALRRSG